MTDITKMDIEKWGALKIPAISLILIGLLLLTRNVNDPAEFEFIKMLVKFTIGSSVIGYSQSLLFKNNALLRQKSDLPTWVQIGFILLHIAWFFCWLRPLSGCFA